MKGVLLLGGSGSRLGTLTRVVNKHLLPVYDQPLACYPLANLVRAGMREILLISGPEHIASFRVLFGDGRQWGLRLAYAVQQRPGGIAEALLLAEDWLAGDAVCLALGDNVIYGRAWQRQLAQVLAHGVGASIYAQQSVAASRFGVVVMDADGRAIDLQEKPQPPCSPWAVLGFYVYDEQACRLARELRPSARGELEITDLNRCYLQQGQLRVHCLPNTVTWLDAGTPESLLVAGNRVREAEQARLGPLADLDAIAWECLAVQRSASA